ncbi:MAG: hypothetical protein EOO29_15915 [Comamonadaceae bacterium]|nr:MAG: hypothetical protein EOO29_15915 [Comamonadaceae bacterium]
MHRTLLRILLLAVCFHTALGMPWHLGQHLPGRATPSTVAHAQAHPHPAGDSAATAVQARTHAHEDDAAEAHGACAWCLAHAQQGHALAQVLPGAGPAASLAEPRMRDAAALLTTAGQRWPFASRDPPPHHRA